MENIESKIVFLSGCGGGYDIFGSLPLYFKMKSSGNHDITLINYSFTTRILLSQYSEQLTTILFRVDPTKNVSWLTDEIYFPEQRLANELEIPIYVILCHYDETRIELIVEAYRYLIQGRIIDEIILIDCGSDILLKGNERQLGTPVEDVSHARAIHLLSSEEVKSKYISVIGTNIDVGHGIFQSDIDERLATLSSYTVFKWLWKYEDDENIRRYVDIFSRCNPQHSIVHSLVCAALQGQRGYYLPEHLRSRVHKSLVPLSEETCLSICYPFDDVMRDNIYFEQLTPEMNLNGVHQVIYSVKRNVSSHTEMKKSTSSAQSISNSQRPWFSQLLSCVCSPRR